MKKKFLVWLLFLLSIFSFTFAQNSSVWDVTVEFCNDDTNAKKLNLVMEGGIEGDICMDFTNYSSEDVVVKYGFVDGVMTAGEDPRPACKNEWEWDAFGQYVSQDTDTITILAWQTVRQKAKIKYPAGFSGMVNGCLTYYIAQDQSNLWDENNMFSVLVRRAKFINVLVGGELKRNVQFSNSDAVSYYYDSQTDEFVINISLTNSGNVDENLSITWVVTNAFGYKKDILIENIKMISDSTQNIEIRVGDLPRYKLSYNADLTMVGEPEFAFDVSSDEMKQPVVIHLSLDMFHFPWIILAYVLWWIVVIILICYLVKHLKFQK